MGNKLDPIIKRSAGVSSLDADDITVEPNLADDHAGEYTPKRGPRVAVMHQGVTTVHPEPGGLIPDWSPGGRAEGEPQDDLAMLMEMHDLLASEIETRKGEVKAPVTLRIDQILHRQSQTYDLLKKQQSESDQASQLQDLVKLGERFFSQMTQDNQEIRELIAHKTKSSEHSNMVAALKKLQHEESQRKLSEAKVEIDQLKTLLSTDSEHSQADEILSLREENRRLRESLEELHSKRDTDEIEFLEEENESLRDQLAAKDEALEVIQTQVALKNHQMRFDMETKINTIEEMENELMDLSDKLSLRDDLTEIGRFMMADMREQQLLEALEETKCQLLETMDELEDVSEALHRETLASRELEQIILIRDQKIKLLEMTNEDLRLSYDNPHSTTPPPAFVRPENDSMVASDGEFCYE